jgi:hypothetical protein
MFEQIGVPVHFDHLTYYQFHQSLSLVLILLTVISEIVQVITKYNDTKKPIQRIVNWNNKTSPYPIHTKKRTFKYKYF